jgi:ribosome biogenesis GTPase
MTTAEGIIVKGVGGAYSVTARGEMYTCTARGVFRLRGVTPLVGDYVSVEITDPAERIGTLTEIKPRRNELARPRAANIDQVIAAASAAQPAFDAYMLDRYLLLAENAQIPSVIICVNKMDAWPGDAEDAEEMLLPYRTAGYEIFTVSAVTGQGLDGLRWQMAGKLSLFAGASGVGKSSLIGQLTGIPRETGNISKKLGRGKHTTRHTEILPLSPFTAADTLLPGNTGGFSNETAGFCVDTPGFSQIELDGIPPERYAYLYREFRPFLGKCFFSDCRHLTENGCQVREQVGRAIHPARYQSYAQLYRDAPSIPGNRRPG